MKKRSVRMLAICVVCLISLCACKNGNGKESVKESYVTDAQSQQNEEQKEEKREDANKGSSWSAIGEGNTLETRINVPKDYQRVVAEEGSLAEFLRGYEMKPDGRKILLYDGSARWNQNNHVAVFTLPIENRDLQQCADSVMRVYGEYYYARGEYDKICFPMGGGFIGNFAKWSQGYRIRLEQEKLGWVKDEDCNSSYESFVKFMHLVFAYSGTLHMEEASTEISLKDAQIGDIFIKGGSPGHVVMIVDMCENKEGEKAFLFGQGYMPAQEFHVITNPRHKDDPWYYENEIVYPFHTAEYTFPEHSLKRLNNNRD